MGVRRLLFVVGVGVILCGAVLAAEKPQPQGASIVSATARVPFSSNGCSGFRETTFFSCCFVHDFAYWAGGNRRDRSAADHALRRCINDIGKDYIRSYIAFFLMRLGLGSGVFVFDGWGRAWSGTNRGRFKSLTPGERSIVDDARRQVCQSLTLEPDGRYNINARFIRETDHHHLRPREERELCDRK